MALAEWKMMWAHRSRTHNVLGSEERTVTEISSCWTTWECSPPRLRSCLDIALPRESEKKASRPLTFWPFLNGAQGDFGMEPEPLHLDRGWYPVLSHGHNVCVRSWRAGSMYVMTSSSLAGGGGE